MRLKSKCRCGLGSLEDNELIFIGKGSNVQENCIFHTDMGFPLIIGENCTIGHGVIIHGASIERNCLIGMGTIY